MSPGVKRDRERDGGTRLALGQDRGGGRSGRAPDLLVAVREHGSLRAPEGERLRREVEADGTEAAQHVGAQQADRLTRHAEVGQGGRASASAGSEATPATDHDVTPTGCAFPVQPTPANSVREPIVRQVQRGGQVGVDDGLPGPGVDDERVRALAVDADVDQFGHLARHRAHGDRNALGATAQRGRPRRSRRVAGGRAKFTSGSTWTWPSDVRAPPAGRRPSCSATSETATRCNGARPA